MDLVLKISAVLGVLAASVSLVTACYFCVRWIFGLGKGRQAERNEIQAVQQEIKELTEQLAQAAGRGDRTLALLEEHARNQALHVNAELQTFMREEDKTFKADVRSKLEELLRGK